MSLHQVHILHIKQISHNNIYVNFVFLDLFMDVLEKITCLHSDNALSSFINMGFVHKKTPIFPKLAPCLVSMFLHRCTFKKVIVYSLRIISFIHFRTSKPVLPTWQL